MEYTQQDIERLLASEGAEAQELLRRGGRVKASTVGDGIYLRGLVEYSNVCSKNCLYCGIRGGNEAVNRYTMTDDEVLAAARLALDNNYGSIVLQAGEVSTAAHKAKVESLVRQIKALSGNQLGITLSLGEQSLETYRRWFDAGAHRYLLRIETSNPALYERIHPADGRHLFENRVKALEALRTARYQVGTGVMIGLPGQTISDLAADIVFMRDLDIDMCGMGPYVESAGAPLSEQSNPLTPAGRLELTLKMIAALRIVMPDINIAATTALQAIDPQGRLRAIEAGANVIMPNITPQKYRADYSLYNNKPLCWDSQIIEDKIVYGQWGDSLRFSRRSAFKR